MEEQWWKLKLAANVTRPWHLNFITKILGFEQTWNTHKKAAGGGEAGELQ